MAVAPAVVDYKSTTSNIGPKTKEERTKGTMQELTKLPAGKQIRNLASGTEPV
jgi:hypothetical protein